jgi:hypothetical protein
MFAEKVIKILPIKSKFLKLVIGSTLTALMISLGMVFILDLFHFSINSAIPSAFAAIGAAIYASRFNSKR